MVKRISIYVYVRTQTHPYRFQPLYNSYQTIFYGGLLKITSTERPNVGNAIFPALPALSICRHTSPSHLLAFPFDPFPLAYRLLNRPRWVHHFSSSTAASVKYWWKLQLPDVIFLIFLAARCLFSSHLRHPSPTASDRRGGEVASLIL